MLKIDELLKGKYSFLTPREILSHPVDVLLGCDDHSVNVLKKINIHTVFDLATSRLFGVAKELTDASKGANNSFSAFGFANAESIANELLGKPISDLTNLDLEAIDGIGPIKGEDLKSLTGVTSIRDFAYWPPFRTALYILNHVLGVTDNPDEKDAPSELLPTGRNYATEKRFYEKVFLYDLGENEQMSSQELDEPLSLNDMLDSPQIFKKPAFGSVLTFEQAWYPQGVSLGQLLHSLALAPAESTRIAIIDWSRSSTIGLTETVGQTEELGQAILQNRSIAEITEGVVAEFQTGQSQASSQASTTNFGASGGFMGIGVSVGHSDSSGSANSSASSNGRRNVTADAMQLIKNSTQQNATSSRTKRASVVKETKQDENEKIQTRLITNYNHSHALSIHYYEVVQMYRMAIRLDKADRCIFIPLQLIDFNNSSILERYNTLLANNILDQQLRSTVKNFVSYSHWKLNGLFTYGAFDENVHLGFPDINQHAKSKGVQMMSGAFEIPEDAKIEKITLYGAVLGQYLDGAEFIKVNEIEGIKIHTSDGYSDIKREDFISVETINTFEVKKIEFTESSSNTLSISIKLAEGVTSINNAFKIPLKISFTINNEQVELGYVWEVKNVSSQKTFELISITEKQTYLSGEQLNENQLYYSQLIWSNLDPQSVSMLLAPFKYSNKPLITQVDPNPLGVYSNYLILKYYGDADTKWNSWSKDNLHFDTIDEELVPIPTGGVFAESILGRYNGSEKIDLTRFWNWQDSPITQMAPEIAPIQAGGRATGDEIASPGLQPSLINITNPPALPDPTGMSSLTSLLTASNVFRDMSNAGNTSTLLQQAQTASSTSAQQIAKTASDNMKIASETAVQLAQIEAGQKIKDSKNSAGAANPTYTGGLINAAKQVDGNKANSNVGSKSTNTPNTASSGSQATNATEYEERILRQLIGDNNAASGYPGTGSASGSGSGGVDEATSEAINSNPLQFSEEDLESNDQEEVIEQEVIAGEFSYVPSDMYAGDVNEVPEFKILKHYMKNSELLIVAPEIMDPGKMSTSFFNPYLNQPFIEDQNINRIIQEVREEIPMVTLSNNEQINLWDTTDDSGIKIAVVDVTDINQPLFGGWRHMENIHGASIAKLSVVFATYQLDRDINNVVDGLNLSSIQDVQQHMNTFWGISSARAPRLEHIFEWTGTKVRLLDDVEFLLTGSGLNQTDKLYQFLKNDLKMHFMNSVLISSGLFDPSNGGIWHRANNFYHPQIVRRLADRNVNAASVALLYTFLAQKKLADPELSAPIDLEYGCSWFSYSVNSTGHNEAAKCGILRKLSDNPNSQYSWGYHHESVYWKDDRTNKSYIFVALVKYKRNLLEVFNFRIQVLNRLVEKLTGVKR